MLLRNIFFTGELILTLNTIIMLTLHKFFNQWFVLRYNENPNVPTIHYKDGTYLHISTVIDNIQNCTVVHNLSDGGYYATITTTNNNIDAGTIVTLYHYYDLINVEAVEFSDDGSVIDPRLKLTFEVSIMTYDNELPECDGEV